MRSALEDGGLQPEDIDYINTHGTSTPLGDIARQLAIKEVFGDHVYKVNISSTKSMTGHCLWSGGAIEGHCMYKKYNRWHCTTNHQSFHR
jgi:3-oxoacyl-[acyl-carrier-protein] synthase II